MNFESIVTWVRENTPKIFSGIAQFIAFTAIYLAGKKTAEKNIELESTKNALAETSRVLHDREKIRDKYNRLRNTTPNDWDSIKRMRKADKN